MKNNKIGKIKETLPKLPRSRFNFAHDVNTTAAFGDLQPLQCKMLVPGSKTTCSIESLVRMSPLVRPCFGRIKYKMWHSFVGLSDLLPEYSSALLAGTTISRGSSTFVPNYFPYMPLGVLSLMILSGAEMTAYGKSGTDTLTGNLQAVGTVTNLSTYAVSIDTAHAYSQLVGDSASGTGLGFNFGQALTGGISFGYYSTYPVWIGLNTDYDASTGVGDWNDSSNVRVPLKSADYVITSERSVGTFYYAFRLSSFGKRLRKILLGCGYQIDFTSTHSVSLMPLFAYYKAYFDSFGLCLYNNWESTYASQVLSYIDYHNSADVMYNFNNDSGFRASFSNFLVDLGNCFVTEEQNFVSAHQRTPTVSVDNSLYAGYVAGIVNSGQESNEVVFSHLHQDSSVSPISLDGDFGHALHTAGGMLSYQSIDMLKKLYLTTNRNTMAGRKIADLLRANGLGDYVDSCKSNFIGYDEVTINISDVLSQSDTFDNATGTGRELGDYAGKGIAYDKTKVCSFENNEFGFWVTLAAICPAAGFSQSVSQDVMPYSRTMFYAPEFDGLGYELSQKWRVVGSVDWASNSSTWSSPSSEGFGYIPRYSGYKVADNVMNGDFSLRGTRDGYLPFTADRYIDTTERVVTGTDVAPSYETVSTPNDLPIAGDVWRYTARYPWLSNYNRIFSSVGLSRKENSFLIPNAEFAYNMYDNFLIHNILNMQCYAPMKPIEESFGTIDDDFGPNASTEKR